ncbi:MAG: T9SS type A sorting domain-containing protein [Bacteroidales bacterium]|nr:T9SS type A sorting domain-containing protein [Bacteroidales bacterium]
MKKVFLLLIAFSLSISMLGQVTSGSVTNPDPSIMTDSVVNNREHGDYYLYPEPTDSNCSLLLDVYGYCEPTIYTSYYNWYYGPNFADTINDTTIIWRVYEPWVYFENIIKDCAQPYQTDTMLTIIGAAMFSPMRYYHGAKEGGRHGYICIADSNLNIIRKSVVNDIPIEMDSWDKVNWYQRWLDYEEFFFDTAINVKEKFYVVLDNPKPLDGYNWEDVDDSYLATQTHRAIITADRRNTHCGKRSLRPLVKEYVLTDEVANVRAEIDSTKSDSNWHEPYYTGAITDNSHGIVEAYYLFPIFKELDTTIECIYKLDTTMDSSSVESIAVDNYTFVFPNPASDNVTVQCSFRINAIEIFNEQGQKNEELKPNGYNAKIDVSKYIKGNYILKIKTQSGSCSKKIVVQ